MAWTVLELILPEHRAHQIFEAEIMSDRELSGQLFPEWKADRIAFDDMSRCFAAIGHVKQEPMGE